MEDSGIRKLVELASGNYIGHDDNIFGFSYMLFRSLGWGLKQVIAVTKRGFWGAVSASSGQEFLPSTR